MSSYILMPFSGNHWVIRSAMAAFALTAGFTLASAQTAQNASTRAEDLKQAVTSSEALFEANRVAEAEQALFAANRSSPNTAKWNVEAAWLLVRIAGDTSARGESAVTEQIARRALLYLAAAQRLATSDQTGIVSNANELAGYIYERYIGDLASAEASYRAAVTADANSGSAKDALDRLVKSELEAAKKGQGNQG